MYMSENQVLCDFCLAGATDDYYFRVCCGLMMVSMSSLHRHLITPPLSDKEKIGKKKKARKFKGWDKNSLKQEQTRKKKENNNKQE